MGWWIALLLIMLIAVFPIGVSLSYNEGGFTAHVIAWMFRFHVFPLPKKDKKRKSQGPSSKPSSKKATTSSSVPPQQTAKSGGTIQDFIPLIEVGIHFLSSFRKKIRVNYLMIHLILAADDPCDLAVNYSRAWAAIGNLLPRLERFLHIQKRDIEVASDFVASDTKVTAQLDLTITLGRIAGLAVIYGYQALREFLILRKKRKGGASV